MRVKKAKDNGLTNAQVTLFWKAFSAACFSLGIRGKEDREIYRKEVMFSATGKESIKDLNRTTDFDAVLQRFYADANDYQRAAETAVQDAKRLAFLIKVICLQLMQLKGGDSSTARAYLSGLFEQAKMGNFAADKGEGYWLDLTFTNARKVFSMLDIHRRRLLRSWRGNSAFSPRYSYCIDGPILIRQNVGERYYDNLPFTVNFKAQ